MSKSDDMETKDIEWVFSPPEVHMVGDGFRMHNFIPGLPELTMERMDPFLVLDYNSKHNFPPTDKIRGVGVHPHRGFETVTIVYHGKIAHNDSAGGGGVIGQGDVQWMTAGSGILHKEFHEEEFSKQGGDFQMVQLWVNLPRKDKMTKPKYQPLKNEQISKVQLENGFGIVEIIAGEFQGTKGSASTFSPVNVFNAKLNQGGNAEFNFPAEFNTGILVIEGKIKVNESELVAADHFILFKNQGETFKIQATENSVVLILSGQPLHEPIMAHGPFVMNTRQEIWDAFHDYNSGKFGYLDEEF